MADPFPVSGNIDPTTFPNLLVDLHRQGATGSLKINGPIHPKALYFRGGRILFGSSNDPRDQLGAILIESGKITREQLDEVNAKVGPGNPLAKVLDESGFVSQRELGDAARDKVERILSDVLSWDAGSFEFEDGVLPKGAVDLKLSTGKLLLAAVERITDRAFALRHLGGDMSVVLAPLDDAEDSLADVRAEVWPLLERLDGQRTLQDAVALTRFEEFEAAKIACAMLFLGIIRRADAGGGEELDLAQEARSGMDAPPPAGAPGEPAAPVVPEAIGGEPIGVADEPLGVADEPPPVVVPEPEPATAGPPVVPDAEAAIDGFRIPEPEPVEAEPIPEAVPEPPAPVPEEIPAAVPIPEPAVPGTDESTGFDFVEADEPIPGVAPMPEAEPLVPPVPPPPTAEPAPPEPPPPVPPPPAPEAPVAPTVALGAEPTVALPPDAPASAEAFAIPPPPRPKTDTVPGDRPAYTPPSPPGGEDTVAVEIPEPPPASPRPTKEDLAALDALLNPGEGEAAPAVERPRAEKWEPQFRPGTTPPGRRVVGRRGGGSRNRLYAALGGLAIVVVGGAAAAYMYLGGSSEPPAVPTPPPAIAPTPAPPPSTTAPAPVEPDPAQGVIPGDPVAGPPPGTDPAPPVTAAAAPTPPPAPAPTPTPQPPPPVAAGDALALLRQGDLDASARQSAATLAAGPQSRYAIQALVACSPETIHKAVAAVPDDLVFILPVNYQGRDCHRICWGVFEDEAAAQAAAVGFPTYFRENGISPRIQRIVDLLP